MSKRILVVEDQEDNRQILRFVAEADLGVLDPIWTSAYITDSRSSHGG